MRIHQGKPFPVSFFDNSFLKVRHYLAWWCICNELDTDEDGVIRVSRRDLERIFAATQGIKSSQLTLILMSLQKLGYLRIEIFHGARAFKSESYAIQILEDAWAPKIVKRKVYAQKNTRADRREIYEQKRRDRLAALLLEVSDEDDDSE